MNCDSIMVVWRPFRYRVELDPISILPIKILFLVVYSFTPKTLYPKTVTTFFKIAIRKRIQSADSRVRPRGYDYFPYGLIDLIVDPWGGEYMQKLHLQIHLDFIPMTSRVIIWDKFNEKK